MKNLEAIIENSWVELLPVVLTNEQKAIEENTSFEQSVLDAKRLLFEEIQALQKKPADSTSAALAQSAYVANKPILLSTDNYELISTNVSIENNIVSGIINCRVNNEHKQIRF